MPQTNNLPAPATVLKAEAIKEAIAQATGQRPTIAYQEKKAIILFSKPQAEYLQKWIEDQAKKESDIKIELSPILIPLAIKKAGPIVAGAAAALFLLGYLSGRK